MQEEYFYYHERHMCEFFVKPYSQSPSPKSPIQGTGADNKILWATTI